MPKEEIEIEDIDAVLEDEELDVDPLGEITPEEEALLEEETTKPDEVPEPPEKEVEEPTDEEEGEKEPEVSNSDLLKQLKALERKNSRMARRVERLREQRQVPPPVQPQSAPAPTQVEIPPDQVQYADNGNFTVDPSVLQQLQAPAPDAVQQQVEDAQRQERGRILAENQRHYEDIRDALTEDNPALEETADKLEAANLWLLTNTITEARALNFNPRNPDELTQLLEHTGLDEDFAEQFPDIELKDFVDIQYEPIRKSNVRKLLRKYGPENPDANGDTKPQAQADPRTKARSAALGKPRSMAKKGRSSNDTPKDNWTIESLVDLEDDKLQRVLKANPKAHQLWEEHDFEE